MNEKKEFYIIIKGEKVTVSEEVYRAYIRPLRAERLRKLRAWKCQVKGKKGNLVRCQEDCSKCSYDVNRPKNERYTNTVDIYLPIIEVVELCRKLETGVFAAKVKEYKANKDSSSLYESLGGLSAKKLKEKGKARKDKKSLSRVMNIIAGQKSDLMLIAESGPGEETEKGLIATKFGDKPENKVIVSMTFAAFSEMMLMTKLHYSAWLAGWYQHRSAVIKAQRQAKEQSQADEEEEAFDDSEDDDDIDEDYDDIE